MVWVSTCRATWTPTTGWATYVKVTNEKRRSWMHAETQPKGYYGTLDLPTTRGNGGPARRMEELY